MNLTPRFTELVSVASVAPDGATSGQMVHGHWPPASNALLVVNVYVYGRHRLAELVLWPR